MMARKLQADVKLKRVSRAKARVSRKAPTPLVKPIDFEDVPRSPAARLVSRLLAWIGANRARSWAALLLYAVVVTLPHEQVQAFCSAVAVKITHAGVYRISVGIGLLEVGAVSWFLNASLTGLPQRRRTIGLWILTFVLVACAWRVLTANNLELVHYAQYFPEGVVLAALTLSPAEALSWVAVLGGIDEAYQYWVLSGGRPTVFDFNDIYMDLLGGAAGVVFALAFLRWTRVRRIVERNRPGVVVLVSTITAGVALWAVGMIATVEDKAHPHYWFALGRFGAPSFWVQIVSNGPYRYHTLTPAEGVAAILATVALYTAILRKYVITCATS
jgi:hypothetical protein